MKSELKVWSLKADCDRDLILGTDLDYVADHFVGRPMDHPALPRRAARCGDFFDRYSARTSRSTESGKSGIGLYKTEVIRARGPWRNADAVEFATLEWVDWFTNRRILEPLGYVSPAEYEDAYYRIQDTPAMEAGLT